MSGDVTPPESPVGDAGNDDARSPDAPAYPADGVLVATAEGEPHADEPSEVTEPADDPPETPPDLADPVELDDAEHPARPLIVLLEAAVVAACSLFVFLSLHPELVLRNNTPTGGDMGAHVWGPAFLRDVLLPQLRLSGWADGWYAGFPAYTFYMVVPALLIVAINVGPPLLLTPVLLTGVILGTVWAARRVHGGHRVWMIVGGVMLALLCVPVPYGIAFKLVAVSGIVSLPITAWAFGRLAGVPFPIPPLLSLGAMMFLFDAGTSTTITGGNIASTMAGEFSFSMSLSMLLLFLGVFIRAVRTGRYVGTAAVLYGLVMLLHVIPAIYGAVAVVLIVLVHVDVFRRTPRRLVVLGVPVAAGMIAAFWMLPFYVNRTYLNDMGWEKTTEYLAHLWPGLIPPGQTEPLATMLYSNFVFVLAVVGMVLSIVHMLRLGWVLAGMVVASGIGFVLMPQGRFWNLRILPMYRLGLYLLGAVGVGLVVLSAAELWRLARRRSLAPVLPATATLGVATLVIAFAIMVPLQIAPGGGYVSESDGAGGPTTSEYRWLGLPVTSASNVRAWARWNFLGYEGAPDSAEFFALIDTMDQVGREHGCGRAMWEYGKFLDGYGTPMAPMLLPYFTDGCIGSMEGLFFEASATTPFHFLNQSELSQAPSRAMRDIPYSDLDIEQGIEHLRMLGVSYYLTNSPEATKAARDYGELTEVATSNQWTVWQIPDVEAVSGVTNEPAVWSDVEQGVHGWVLGDIHLDPNDPTGVRKTVDPGPAIQWYNDPSQWDVLRAADGPPAWQRISSSEEPERRPVPEVQVSNIRRDDEGISFEVDRPGTPVLVRSSYFPNWRASGAEGPYRVAPNLMVVVPTSTSVELTYGRSMVEYLGLLLTLLGLGLAVMLSRWSNRREAAALLEPIPTEPILPEPILPESNLPESNLPEPTPAGIVDPASPEDP